MITPLHPSVIGRAIEVVERTNAFLVGCLLSVQWKGTLVVRDVHRVLTQMLPVDTRRRLGVRTTGKDGEEHLLAEDHLHAISDAMAPCVEWGRDTQPDPAPDERERRCEQLLGLLHDMLAASCGPAELAR